MCARAYHLIMRMNALLYSFIPQLNLSTPIPQLLSSIMPSMVNFGVLLWESSPLFVSCRTRGSFLEGLVSIPALLKAEEGAPWPEPPGRDALAALPHLKGVVWCAGSASGHCSWLVRAVICGVVYALLWGVKGFLPPDMTTDMWQWVFLAPPFLVAGALAALATLDLDWGTGVAHYSLYVMFTALLRWLAGFMPV
jgi:hypothetical protein